MALQFFDVGGDVDRLDVVQMGDVGADPPKRRTQA